MAVHSRKRSCRKRLIIRKWDVFKIAHIVHWTIIVPPISITGRNAKENRSQYCYTNCLFHHKFLFIITHFRNSIYYRHKHIYLYGLREPWAKTVSKFRSEEHTSELQSRENLVCRLLLEKKNKEHMKTLS